MFRHSRLVAALSLALAAAGALMPSGPTVVLAGGGLVTVMDATYLVQPEQGRVHVTVDAVSTSHEEDSPEGPVYYAGLSMSVPPGSSNVAATSGGEPLEVTVTPSADETRIDIGFSTAVFLGDSFTYQVTFDMFDPGGAADRDFRIGHSVVAFPVWAFGSPEGTGSSVAVVLPAAFTPAVYGGPLVETIEADGTIVLAADMANPPEWFAYVTAERPGIFTATPFTLPVGGTEASVIIRAWDDDPEWGIRTRDLLTRGLPALHDLVGLPWPVAGDLKVEESANRLGDYAGIYNRLTEKINVRYDADGTVTLHEAAHIWFNDELFRDRWIGEAWAEFYAIHSAATIGVSGQSFTLTDDLMASRIPLNEWGAIGRESQNVEAYAYAASYQLAELIFERTDYAGLRAVWQAADAGQMAYQPIHPVDDPRTGVAFTQEGWQRLLDLLEERTGTAYSDLWTTWVVNPGDAALLVERAAARDQYAEVVANAGDWELPELVRYQLSSWQFDEATDQLETAGRILELAADLGSLADELDLDPPTQLRSAFEGSGGLDAALTEANKELVALERIDDATRELAVEPEPVAWIGLLFAEPELDLAAAREAWERGEHRPATDHADAVLTVLDEADDRGRERLAIGGVVFLAGAGGVAVVWRRRRSADLSVEGSAAGPPAPDSPSPTDEGAEEVA